nr:hypothetical protein [Tanacetum cinerariifolium]
METRELLENDQLDLFLLKDLEKLINQSDLKSCNSIKDKFVNNSDIEMSIRHIDPANTSYSEAQETEGPNRVKNKHLYLASANEIDEKKLELKDFPFHLEYAYLHGNKSLLIFILSKLSEVEKISLLQVLKKHKGAEDLAADHSSRLENPHMEVLTERNIADEFPDKHLMLLNSKFNDDEPWYADFVNYIIGKVVPPNWTFKKRKRCVAGSETLKLLAHCHSRPTGGHHSASVTKKKVYQSIFYWNSVFKDVNEYGLDFMGPFPDTRVVKFLRGLFARFRVPKALINDRGIHFCNSQLEKALQKYGVTHKLSTAYHPQSNEQTEVTNNAIKRILERSVGYNPKDWSEKLNDSLLAFRMAYKTPTGRLMQLNESSELRDGNYENTRIYKERTKKWHDFILRGDRDFKVRAANLNLDEVKKFIDWNLEVRNSTLGEPNDGEVEIKIHEELIIKDYVNPAASIGERIHAVVKNELIPTFEPLLKQCMDVVITKFGVVENGDVISNVVSCGKLGVYNTHDDKRLKMEIACVVMATVTFIEPELDSYYLECVKYAKNKVHKSQVAYLGDIDVIDEDGVTLICRKCKTIQPKFVQRFKVSMKVEDCIGCASFVLLDSDLTKMTEYNITTCWNVYTILRLCDDDNIIQQMIKDDATKDVVCSNRDWFPPTGVDAGNPSSSMVKRKKDMFVVDCSTNCKLMKLKIETP